MASALRELVAQLGMSQGASPSGMASWQQAVQNVPQRKPEGQQLADMLGGVSLPMSAFPVAGDVTGLAADAAMYANYPEERTLGNYALTALGVLPFVPAASAARAGKRAARQIDTPQFKNWFGSSKVVDEAGRPRVVYHGTSSRDDFDVFDPDKGSRKNFEQFGNWFTSSPAGAEQYARYLTEEGRTSGPIIPTYISMQNPWETTWDDMLRHFEFKAGDLRKPESAKKIREYLKASGKDGVIVKGFQENPNAEMQDVFIALDPTQIKSAIGNRGTFDPSNPNMMYGAGGMALTGSINQQRDERKK